MSTLESCRRRWLPSHGVCWVVLLMAAASSAHAQPSAEHPQADDAHMQSTESKPATDSPDVEQARAHFQRGVDYYAEGDYQSARLEFKRAYALQRAYRLLYNLGQVSDELRDYAGAERYFRAYLVEGEAELSAERREEVTQELTRLQTRVASLRLKSDVPGAEIRIDDHVIARPDAGPVRVSAGQRRITANKRGYSPVQRVIDVIGGDELTVPLRFGPPLLAATGTTESASMSASMSGRDDVWPWVTGIASGALLLGGAGFGYWAYHDSSEYTDRLQHYTTHAELDHLASQAAAKAVVADVMLGTALVGAVVTLVMLTTRESSDTAPVTAKSSALRFRF